MFACDPQQSSKHFTSLPTCSSIGASTPQDIEKSPSTQHSASIMFRSSLRSIFVFSSLIADGANQRATTLPIPRVVTRDLPISPRFTPTNFYRDAGSALLHLVNQWLNFRTHVLTLSAAETRRKFTPAESRTHKFRLSGHTLYPLVHGGSPL